MEEKYVEIIQKQPIPFSQRVTGAISQLHQNVCTASIMLWCAPIVALERFFTRERQVIQKVPASIFAHYHGHDHGDGEDGTTINMKLQDPDNDAKWKKEHRKYYGDDEED